MDKGKQFESFSNKDRVSNASSCRATVQSGCQELLGIRRRLVIFETSQISLCGASDTLIQSQKQMYKVMDSHNPWAPKVSIGVMLERRG